MEASLTILSQIIKMFLLMSVGYYVYTKKYVNEDGSQQISNVLLKICTPAIMVMSFNIPFSFDILKEMAITFVISSFSFFIGYVVAKLVYKNDNRVGQFAIMFSNAGFIGIPLVQSLLGDKYILYLSVFIIAFNIYAWTIGVYLVSGRRDLIRVSSILKSPAMIGLALGMLVFVSPIKLPSLIMAPVSMIGNLNTPLAMLVLGTYIAKNNIMEVFKSKSAYFVSFFRLIVVPLITVFALMLVPAEYHKIKQVILIASSTPVAVMAAMLAQQYGKDFEYGARIVSLSTILCLVTIPIILILSEVLW